MPIDDARVDISAYTEELEEITVAACHAEPGYTVESFSGYLRSTDSSFFTSTDTLPETEDRMESYLEDHLVFEVYLDAKMPAENTPFGELRLEYEQQDEESVVTVKADNVDDPDTWAMCRDALTENLSQVDAVDRVEASGYVTRTRDEDDRREFW